MGHKGSKLALKLVVPKKKPTPDVFVHTRTPPGVKLFNESLNSVNRTAPLSEHEVNFNNLVESLANVNGGSAIIPNLVGGISA
jgi:hypothetical protein